MLRSFDNVLDTIYETLIHTEVVFGTAPRHKADNKNIPGENLSNFLMMSTNNNTSPSNGEHAPLANNAANLSKKSSSNLLLKLLEACARHKRRHEHERREPSTSIEEERLREQKCLGELNQFAAFLPRIEATVNVRESYSDEYQYNPPSEADDEEGGSGTMRGVYPPDNTDQTKHLRSENNDEDDAGNLCALYRAIAKGSFCPKAAHYLFSDQISSTINGEANNATTGRDAETKDIDLARGILPRVFKLLQFLTLDPVRMAMLPLKLPQNKKTKTMPTQHGRDAVRSYYQDEDVGSTIASLLALLQSNRLRLATVQDLINLANDLNTIDESRSLFHPPTSSIQNEIESTTKEEQSKIRVRAFTEISSFLEADQDSDECAEKYAADKFVRIHSRRSLLALQCGVWAAIQHLIPVISDSISLSSSLGEDKSLVLLESARLVLSSQSLLPESQLLGWKYSRFDLSVHSLLSLRIKLGIVGLLNSMATSKNVVIQAVGSVVSTSTTLELAVLAVEAAKFEMSRKQSASVEEQTHDKSNKNCTVLPAAMGLDSELTSIYSWTLSSLLVSAVALPDHAPSSRDEIWLHCFPHVIDCIANVVDTSDRNKWETSLGNVVLRLIHAIIQRGRKTSNLAVLHLLQNRCHVRGFFSQLFDLANDSSDAISGPVIAILIDLLVSRSESAGVSKHVVLPGDATPENDVENSCRNALASVENHDQMDVDDTENMTSSIRLGNKRRRVTDTTTSYQSTVQIMNEGTNAAISSSNTSIQASFAHAIADALRSARAVMKKLGAQKSRGPNIISLLSESDIGLLRCITGILRVLCSLRSQNRAKEAFRYTDEVLASLFLCIERVCGVLANPKCESGRMQYVETHLLPLALSLVVNVGLHTCQLPNQDDADFLKSSTREAMSHCALASVSLISDEHDVHSGENLIVGVCSDCCRLGSILDTVARPASSCLCRLDVDANRHSVISDEFITLQCR